MKKIKTVMIVFTTVSLLVSGLFIYQGFAQDNPAPAAGVAANESTPAAGGGTTQVPNAKDQTFWDIVINSGAIGIFIWIMIFVTSAATLGLIIDAFITIKATKIMPPELVNAVRNALNEGDLGAALEACNSTPGPLANILTAGFNNVQEGFDVIMEAVSSAANIESEKLMQRVNYLNLCGALAPMLGLMGTVTGMVDAFAGLASTQGAAKAQMLALAISQALYTTAFGLLISVPAIIAFTFIRNYASRLILNMESLTYDLVKVLRGAEVVDDSGGAGAE